MKKDSIDIFCAVSEGEIGKVKSWLIPSLAKQLNIGKINLTLINFTGKGNIYDGESEIGIVSIKETRGNRQFGFGESHNIAFDKVKPKDYFIIINPDIYAHKNCVERLIGQMKDDPKAGIVEGRQLPFEHPKGYDQKTKETVWASGSCILVRSEFFEKAGGFDERFWMYEEDVDISWRAWLLGFKVLYCPNAVAYHYTGVYFGYNGTRYNIEHLWSLRNFIYLMYKYWGSKGESQAISFIKKVGYLASFNKEAVSMYNELKTELKREDFTDLRKKMRENGRIKTVGFNQFKLEKGSDNE